MKIVPLGANVVIRRLPVEEQTAGGIALPPTAQKRPRQGRVLSVGDGRLLPDGSRVPHQVKEGDRVLIDDYAGAEVMVDDQILVVDEKDILAILP
ncbi:MAG: co-chaperone GroES [Planctomycetaceae bacterium]|nr:co-chaperone GroES [Planctomycetaceae bacterium]